MIMVWSNRQESWPYNILGYCYKGKIYVTNIDDKCFGTNKKKTVLHCYDLTVGI